MTSHSKPYWQRKTLAQMDKDEWEQLCDRCGLCCLVRIQDEESDEIFDTNVICRHYDCDKAQCSSYGSRASIAEGCVELTPELVEQYDWLPDSCAYRTVMRGDALPATHPLVSSEPAVRNVVKIFAATGLVQNGPDVEPEHHLIASDNVDF